MLLILSSEFEFDPKNHMANAGSSAVVLETAYRENNNNET